MTKKNVIGLVLIIGVILVAAFFMHRNSKMNNSFGDNTEVINNDFLIDLVYQYNGRDVHYSAYIPSNIDESEGINMFITLPGWEGLYFQGVGVNLEYEDFAFVARDINPNMIILAPQLNDWGKTSAEDTIALTKYFQETYNISKTYIEGYSGGGETLSLVLSDNADLYDGALMVSSTWDGSIDSVVENILPLYFFIGEIDDYYGSDNFKDTYERIYNLYLDNGVDEEIINDILILDVRDRNYFLEHDMSSEHAGGALVAHEDDIINWLLTR